MSALDLESLAMGIGDIRRGGAFDLVGVKELPPTASETQPTYQTAAQSRNGMAAAESAGTTLMS